MMVAFALILAIPALIVMFRLPEYLLYAVFALIGFMSGPIYPLTLYLAPELFGKEKAHAVLGTQIAVAYSGFVLSQMLMSLIVSALSIKVFTVLLIIFCAALLAVVLLLCGGKKKPAEA